MPTTSPIRTTIRYAAFRGCLPGKTFALTVGVVLIVANLMGARITGRVRAVIVSGVIAVLVTFIVRGSFEVEGTRLEPSVRDPFVADGRRGDARHDYPQNRDEKQCGLG